ncbi:MAG TPA: SHOCT domain-containing protein [Herpetosiphonaceae bacterium]|nr:SHOCT domain-containing protein [Herpetosiphonaceae bacterium]
MKNRATVRSSPESSIVTIIFYLVLGCAVLATTRNLITCVFPGIFFAGGIVVSLLNLTREEGMPETIIDFDLNLPAAAAEAPATPAERLRELSALHDEGLITDDEFLFQRDRVISHDSGGGDDPPAERLRALSALHGEGLITDDEFLERRDHIIAEL